MIPQDRLSRGAKRCLELLQWYAKRFKRVYPSQQTLAKSLDCSRSQVKRYVRELKDRGLIEVLAGGPQSAEYLLRSQHVAEKNEPAMSQQMSQQRSSNRPLSISEFWELKRQETRDAAEQLRKQNRILPGREEIAEAYLRARRERENVSGM